MKQAEIKKDTDYIAGPSSNLFEGVGYTSTVDDDGNIRFPWKMRHIRVIDNRPHKLSQYASRDTAPKLVAEGEKVDRSYNTVGALAVIVKHDGTLSEPFVEKPQNVRQEIDAWRAEYKRRHEAAIVSRRAARERAVKEAQQAEAVRADAIRRRDELNSILGPTQVRAKIVDGQVVLTGPDSDLLDAARATVHKAALALAHEENA